MTHPPQLLIRVTEGEFAGHCGVILERDPKWVKVRITDGRWPFPKSVWVRRQHVERMSRAPADDGIEAALI